MAWVSARILSGLWDCVDGHFGFILAAGMAREKRPIELRTVDDTPPIKQVVPRLGPDPQPLRLIPENQGARPVPAPRLEVPSVVAADNRRSHEPGVEVLIGAEDSPLLAAEEEWSKAADERYPLPWGWFALVGLLLASAVTWSLSHVQQAEPLVAAEHKQAEAVAKETAASDRALEHVIAAMEQQVRRFCEAASIEAMLPLVRHPDQVLPLMERFYAQHPLRPLGFQQVKDFQGAMMGGTSDFWVFSVLLGNGQACNILLEQKPSGSIAVDWETVVTYQPMNWDDYARQRPADTPMEFRVAAEEDHFFSHEFADASRWASFRLTAPDAEETLFGYAARGGEVETELLALIGKSERKSAQVILRLRLAAGTQSRRGVLIEQVMSNRWIYVDPPHPDS
jgi:hypothetical protein